MSNHLAIATVTAALGQIVHAAAASSGVGSVGLEFGRPILPGEGQTPRKVHVYLYQVSPDAALRNHDLPTRGPDGRLVDRPRAALDLHYFIAFYGDPGKLEPDRMLGAVARNLHARPVLSRSAIQDAIGNHPELSGSDLADAVERVRFTPAATSIDELSKLWSIFFQTPHALSIAYQANVVLIEAEEGGPSALPVLRRGESDRGVDTSPAVASTFPELHSIHIGRAEDAGSDPLPRSDPAAQMGAFLILRGLNLDGDVLDVEFKHARYSEPGHPAFLAPRKIAVPPAGRTPTEVRITIPDDPAAQTEWRAGPHTVSIIVKGGGKTRLSNALSLLLAPRVTAITPPNPITRDANGALTLTLSASPNVLPAQSAALLLADREVAVEPRTVDTDPLQFAISDAPTVTDAPIRLRVDGVDSIPFERTGSPPRYRFADSQKVTIT